MEVRVVDLMEPPYAATALFAAGKPDGEIVALAQWQFAISISGSHLDLFLQRLARLSYSQIAFLYLGCLGLTCGRYLRLVGGETVCGNLGGLFVGFLFRSREQRPRLLHWRQRTSTPHYTELLAQFYAAGAGSSKHWQSITNNRCRL